VAVWPVCLSLVVALTFVAERALAQGSPIETTNPTFQASLDRIAKGSGLWRDALDAIRTAGRRTLVVTPDQIRIAAGGTPAPADRFDDTLLAEVAPVLVGGSRVDTVVVVVNIALLQQRHHDQQLLPIEFEMDLDRILIHEIYGHAIPYLLAGDLSGRCADPQPRQRAVDACSIRRENAVRAELGLGRRVDYGLEGLSVSRRR
jgi:hypothetical protein